MPRFSANLPQLSRPLLLTVLLVTAAGFVGSFALKGWPTAHIPVILHGQFSEKTTLNLHFSTEEAFEKESLTPSLPLIPLEPTQPEKTIFLTELPPRQSYRLQLELGTDLLPTAFERIELRNLRDKNASLNLPSPSAWLWTPPDAAGQQPKPSARLETAIPIQPVRLADWPAGTPLPAGSTLTITDHWSPYFNNPAQPLYLGIAALLALGAIACAALLAPFHLRPAPDSSPTSPCPPATSPSSREPVWRGWTVFCAFAHLLLVNGAVSEYWPADSTSYLHKSAHFLEHSTFDTGGYEFEVNRLPGTSALQIAALALLGGNLDGIALLQAILQIVATLFLLRELLPHAPGWSRWLLPPLFLLSPPAVWAANTLASEGPFLSGLIAAAAFWLRYESSTGAKRRNALIGFCLLAVAVNLTRLNGLIILTWPLLHILNACLIRLGLADSPQKRPPETSFLRELSAPLIPVVLVALSLILWSARNASSRDFFAPTDLGPVAMANAPLALGWFDPRALEAIPQAPEAPSLSEEVLRQRYEAGYWFHGWALRRILFVRASDNWKNLNNDTIRHTADHLSAFVEANKKLVPLEIQLAGYIRSASWALFLAAPHNTVYEPLTRGFTLAGSLPENVAKRSTSNIAWVSRQTGHPLAYTSEKPAGWLHKAYNAVAASTERIYPFAALAGLLAYVLAALRGYRLALFAFSLFFANIVLNVYVQYVVARYVMVLDSFLYLGLLVTFAALYQDRRRNSEMSPTPSIHA
jgi:hypothetical protein